jgi:hypothetical protein
MVGFGYVGVSVQVATLPASSHTRGGISDGLNDEGVLVSS